MNKLRSWLAALKRQVRVNNYGNAEKIVMRCEDGTYVIRTKTPVEGGPYHGKYVVQLMTLTSDNGGIRRYHESKVESFKSRKKAAKRARKLYGKHSPQWKARRKQQKKEAQSETARHG